jgi:hypothetical protein
MQTQQMKEACLPCETSLLHDGMFIERLHYANASFSCWSELLHLKSACRALV